jgi:hypothetical protein
MAFYGEQADNAVGNGQRHIARRSIARLREQRWNTARALNEVVVRWPRRVGTILAITEYAGIDDCGIAGGDILVSKAEPCHRLWPHIVDEDVGIRR